jgi:hypothetical protein
MNLMTLTPRNCRDEKTFGQSVTSWYAMRRKERVKLAALEKNVRITIRAAAGMCPSCVFLCEPHDRPATIYRSSNHSVTFRCQKCSLQWTVTFANLHRVAEARLKKGMSKPSYEAAYDFLESITRLAAGNATARKSIVTRQIPRVIRLPDTPGQRSDEPPDSDDRNGA